MSSRMDYKKRLMEYRKSVGATNLTNLKTVAFRVPTTTFHQDEDTHLYSSLQPHFRPLNHHQHQHQHQQFGQQERETSIDENGETSSREPSVSNMYMQQTQSADILETPGSVREGGFMSEPIGRYINWNSRHVLLASQPWCCIADLMGFCDKYEFKAISVADVQTHANIISEVKALLNGKAPFDIRRRFPGNFRNEGNLLVCIGRCPSIEYHLQRILTIFRRPLNKISSDKQNMAKQNFHIAIRELHLDVSARITEVRLYDRVVFENEFNLIWKDTLE